MNLKPKKFEIMKSIIVKNLQIQFDSFDEGADQHTAINTLEEINSVLQERFSDIQPQLFVGMITADDIEIADQPDEEDEENELPDILGTRKL